MSLTTKFKPWLKHHIRKLPMLEKALRFLMTKSKLLLLLGYWKSRSVRRWFADNPADELRFQYDLPPGANILDVGGYNGDFAARFIELCNANVTIFEPASVFASKIKSRFAGEKRVRIHEAGLSDKDEIVDFYINADASSVFGAAEGEKVRVTLWDAEQFLEKCDIDEWHLAKLNIEGGEYALLKRLIDTRRIEKFQYLQIQFHMNVPDAKKQYRELAERLQQTHRRQWRYPFVWESWERRDIHKTRTGSNG